MAQNLWFFFKTSTISSIFITTFWLSLVKDLTNCLLNSLIVSFWEHTFWCNFWKMDAFFQLGGLFLSSSASPKIFLWKLTSNSFHQKQIWEVLSIKGIISDGLELLILILVPFSSSKHIILLPSVCILTFCIVFQSESSSSVTSTRLKMKKEMVACRCLARRQGITTIWISQHGWCVWIPIKNSQGIWPEIKSILLPWKKCQKKKYLTSDYTDRWNNIVHQNVENGIESIAQLAVE